MVQDEVVAKANRGWSCYNCNGTYRLTRRENLHIYIKKTKEIKQRNKLKLYYTILHYTILYYTSKTYDVAAFAAIACLAIC